MQAGEQLGTTGDSGSWTTGGHLHVEVERTLPGGEPENVDPLQFIGGH